MRVENEEWSLERWREDEKGRSALCSGFLEMGLSGWMFTLILQEHPTRRSLTAEP